MGSKTRLGRAAEAPNARYAGWLLSLRFVFVRADRILRSRDRIVGETLIVDTVAVWIADLFIGRSVAFDRAFVNIRIVLLSYGGRVHGDSC